MHNPQPRRYRVRKLYDVDGATQAEIAAELGINQATVARDLKQTVPPAGKTPGGAPYYPPGRFNDDPEYQERVRVLTKQMPELNAKLQAAREFAGPPSEPRGQAGRIRSDQEKAAAWERLGWKKTASGV